MTRSKSIPIMIAACCGLALQFQAAGANAQSILEFGTAGNTYNYNVTPGFTMFEGAAAICSPYVHNCLVMQDDGNLVLYSGVDGTYLWASNTGGSSNGSTIIPILNFYLNGDMQVGYFNGQENVLFDTGTNQGGFEDWSGLQGQYLAVQDDGNLVIYDGDLNAIWAATYDSIYNWGEASNVRQYCLSIGACW
jgi:pseudomonalisin